MRPISVATPVAVTTPTPCPAATSVPEKASGVRSPSGASAATGATDFSTGTDSPVSAASSIRKARPQQPEVGRHAISCLEQDHVAGHEIRGIDRLPPPVAQHRGMRRQHVADGVERLLGAAFLDEADRGVHQDDAEDHRRVGHVAEQRGDKRRGEQHVDQQVGELPEEAPQRAARRGGGQPVRAVPGEALPGLGGGEAGGGGLQPIERRLGGQRVPSGGGRGVACRDRIGRRAGAAAHRRFHGANGRYPTRCQAAAVVARTVILRSRQFAAGICKRA